MWKENEEKPVLKFLIITFLFTYAAEFLVVGIEKLNLLPEVPMKIVALVIISAVALAPGAVVYYLLKKAGRIKGFRDYMKRVFDCRGKKYMILGTLGAFAVFAAVILLTETPQKDFPIYLAPAMLVLMIPGGGWEELGWRGFLQPELEKKFGFFFGTLIMGLIWSVWHLPLWLVQSANQKNFVFLAFMFYCIALSFLLAATYKLTKSVFSVILVHAWGNTMCGGCYTFTILSEGPDIKATILLASMMVISVATSFIIDRKLEKGNPKPEKNA